MDTKKKKRHRIYQRVPEEMKLETAKDYYLEQMPQVEIVSKYELSKTTVRDILPLREAVFSPRQKSMLFCRGEKTRAKIQSH